LQANHINVNKNKVKYLLYKKMNELFPKDKNFLYDITNNTINLKENGNKNIPFCYANNTYLEKIKNNKYNTQIFIIFTCIFLIKLFITSKQLFIDVTFKITPKAYYQTLIIIAKDPVTKLNISSFYTPMSGKNFEICDKGFKSLFSVIKNENILLMGSI